LVIDRFQGIIELTFLFFLCNVNPVIRFVFN